MSRAAHQTSHRPHASHSFNTNGIIKKGDCLSHLSGGQPCDLYVVEDSPQPVVSNFPSIWPIPAAYTNGTTTVSVSASLKFALSGGASNPTLAEAFTRYQGLTFPHVSSASDVEQVLHNLLDGSKSGSKAEVTAPLAALTVTVADLDESAPQLDTDETYTLSIPADGSGATLTAKTIYGAMHGAVQCGCAVGV